ncbi:MAG: SusC/RagA family TonB-linked outer membrane protein [Chitinophagaceae bacterium]|nr:SusC/RagA family TonB-linked outer membrane protein [Chitinophagaceae bacterium]MCA6453060.1 SusC/RagA family TonB-linked outer membrane protein [Chitinophagaceae bacterium]MCA6455854.1 SusC/RagA family TonB-linked outer membrane protein [Chitinophagaceae bacterium]MCA6458202.1 SusC/RagA family TonB-linked outer membrane protein [Chitinophagaceae bacterium]MCA6463914.1 SusC/RagA family TonB-linked outer membrane protein [Chitinophagaceae bacterium]
MKKIVSTLAVALLCFSIAVTAQVRPITGTVKDDQGAPVPSVSVKIKGTSTATVGDANGSFRISAADNAVLVFSAVGFNEVEQKVGKSSVLNITLSKTVNELENVVVTAQGIRKKSKEIGYSYARVSNEEITVGRSPQLAQALSGKVSGLAVYNVNNSVDPSVKVVLRGYRSLTGNNEALVVIDGMQTTSTTLALINPNDIENVSILKGGQAATLYGSAGINGAIVITTKKGAKGKLKVSYSNTTNLEQISFLPWFQDQYGNGSHYAASFGSASWKPNYLDRMKDNWRPFENQQYGDPYDGKDRITGRVLEDGSKFIIPYAPVANARRKAFDIGLSTNNQVSFQGGDDNGTFYMSVENNKINGIVPLDKSERTGVRLGATREYGKLSVGFNASYVQANYDRTNSDFYFDLINVAAHIPINEMRDWRNNKFANPNGFYDDYYNNPYFNKDNNRQRYNDANIQGNLDLNYRAFSWLTVSNKIGVMNNIRTGKNTVGQFLYTDWAKNSAYVPAPWDYANDYDGIDRASANILGSVNDYSNTENVINNEFQLQFKKDLGQFSNKLILGYSLYQRKTKFVSVGSSSIVVPDVYNVSNRQGELTGGESNTLERKYGYYADLTTGYKDWLILNGTFRYDATSRFFKPNRPTNTWSYPYYGVALSFIATDALPSLKSNTLNYAKVRLNVNRNGNDNLPLYGLDLTYPNGGGFPYGNIVGLTVGNTLPDANLKPEFVTSYEAGAELQLFNNRVNLDVTAYTQTSKGQVITVKVPNTTGFSNLLINVGESKNWGYEADLKIQILRARALKWDFNLRYSYNDNKVIDLYPGVDQFQLADGYSYANTNVIKGSRFPVLKSDGYTYAADGSGRRLVNSASGYPIRNTALVERGGTLPRHIMGLGSRLSYKSFSFAFNFEYRGGNKIFSDLGRQMTFTGSGGWTSNRVPHVFENAAYIDASGKLVDNNLNVREAEYGLWVDNYRLISENFVTPGWFIKLRDVNLAWNVPASLIAKTKVFSGASVSVYGRNLFTIKDKSNYFTDPEFSRTTGNGIGLNSTGQTPPVRQYGINLNLTF